MNDSVASFHVQKETKARIEDVIPHYLEGELLKTALDFAAYMRANKMQIKWDAWNRWKAYHKSKVLCWVTLDLFVRPVTWVVSPCLANINKYEESVICEGLQEFVWNSFKRCKSCPGCRRKEHNIEKSYTILNKELLGICGEAYYVNNNKVYFVNPDETAVGRIKKLLELEKTPRESEK